MKATISILISFFIVQIFSFGNFGFGQNEDSVYVAYFKRDIEIVDPNYRRNYNEMLKKIKRVYPYAMYAKKLLDDYESDVSELEKKRQIKKYGKTAHEKLIDDFEYVIKDMYVSDGKVLMKLVYRETGITVYDIIAKYRGKLKASWYTTMGKIFEQDLKVEYYPDKQDWLIERIVKEVEEGKHKVNELKLLSKEDFKEIKRSDKQRSKETKAKYKELNKANEKASKETKKSK